MPEELIIPSQTADFKIFTGVLKAFDGDDGRKRIKGIASSTTKDLHGDVMEESALRDMERDAASNMTIFLNHSYSVPEDVAGSVEKAMVVRRGADDTGNPNWDLDLDIAINEENDRAVKAWSAIKNGTKLGLSIGAMIPEGGAVRDKKSKALTISHVKLMETSIVSIPANPRSWIASAVKALNSKDGLVDAVSPELISGLVEETEDEAVCPKCNDTKRRPRKDCDDPFHSDPEEVQEDAPEPEVITAEEAVDVADSQEAPSSEPENEPVTTVTEGTVPEVLEVSADLDDTLDPVVRQAVESVARMLETTTAKLVASTEALVAEKQARTSAEAQRDEAIAVTNELFVKVRTIVDQIAATPVGRKTRFVEARDSFDHLEGIYSEEFRRLLKQGEQR